MEEHTAPLLCGPSSSDVVLCPHGRRDGFGEACAWHPEYGAWMIEGTPRFPYSGFTADLRRVETNMILRRTRLAASLRPGEAVLSIPAFPTLGTSDFCAPAVPSPPEEIGAISASTSLPDAVINRNPRFHTLTRNIRLRRGSTVTSRTPNLGPDPGPDPDPDPDPGPDPDPLPAPALTPTLSLPRWTRASRSTATRARPPPSWPPAFAWTPWPTAWAAAACRCVT